MYSIRIVMDGRVVSRLILDDEKAIGRASSPAVLETIAVPNGGGELVFLGSTSGPALLMGCSWRWREQPLAGASVTSVPTSLALESDIDLDEGILCK
jgi:hypothetical protein